MFWHHLGQGDGEKYDAMAASVAALAASGGEAAWAGDGLDILAPPSLLALVNHFKGTQVLTRPEPKLQEDLPGSVLDLRDVKGQETAASCSRCTQQGKTDQGRISQAIEFMC